MKHSHIILEIKNGHILSREETLILDYAISVGIPVKYASISQLQRGRVVLDADGLVVGSIPFIKAGLTQMGLKHPESMSYPDSLKNYLYRNVELRLFKDINPNESQFIKPAEDLKKFTGFVIRDSSDFRLHSISPNTKVYTASIRHFLSEYRYYVNYDKIIGQIAYNGHYIQPDSKIVSDMIKKMHIYNLAAYALDVGVLDTGDTALVEVNDAFALGFYGGMPISHYVKMLSGRWRQLTTKI